LAQRPLSAITPADWENIRHEIAAALEASGHGDESVQSDRLPDVEKAQKIHADLANFFGQLLLGEEIRPDSFRSVRSPTYRFNRGSGKWERWDHGKRDPVDVLLEQLIPTYGHLIKVCAAPPARGEAGERCGTWFVAWRPPQIFCSPKCHNRAGAKAFREKKKEKDKRKRRRRATSRSSSAR